MSTESAEEPPRVEQEEAPVSRDAAVTPDAGGSGAVAHNEGRTDEHTHTSAQAAETVSDEPPEQQGDAVDAAEEPTPGTEDSAANTQETEATPEHGGHTEEEPSTEEPVEEEADESAHHQSTTESPAPERGTPGEQEEEEQQQPTTASSTEEQESRETHTKTPEPTVAVPPELFHEAGLAADDEDLAAAFYILDADESETLSMAEVRQGITTAFGAHSPPPNRLDQFFRLADTDQSGFIDPEEFAALIKKLCQNMKIGTTAFTIAMARAEYVRIFEGMSVEGIVSREEAKALLDELCSVLSSERTTEALLSSLDMTRTQQEEDDEDSDGLTKADFITVMSDLTKNKPSPSLTHTFRQLEQERRARFLKKKGKTNKLESLQEENESLQQQLQEAEEAKRQEEGNLVRQAAAHKHEVHELTNRLEEKDEVLESRDKQIASLEHSLSSACTDAEDFEVLKNRLWTSASSEAQLFVQRSRKLEADKEQLEDQVSRLEKELGAQKGFLEMYDEMEASLKAIIKSHKEGSLDLRAKKLKAHAADYRQHHQQLRDDRQALSQRLTQVQEREAQLSAKESSLNEREKALAKQFQNFAVLQNKVEPTSLPERENRLVRLQSLEHELNRRESALAQREATLGEVSKIVNASRIVMQKLEDAQAELRLLKGTQ